MAYPAPSFISNFNVITKALIFAAILALGYAVAVGFFAAAVPRVGPTQHQANIIRIERVWHADHAPDALLAGTSLAARLPASVLDPEMESIAQSATGPMTALLLTAQMEKLPKLVYVEVNMLHQGVDEEALEYFTRQPMASLREIIPVLRQSEQPVNLLLSALVAKRPESETKFDAEKLKFGLQYLFVQNQSVLSQDKIESKVGELRRVLLDLRVRGAEVVLVEFPFSPEVRGAPRYQQSFAVLNAVFPSAEWAWVRSPDGIDWQMTDGLHLTTPSAVDFARLLKLDLRRRLN
ncbi:MAG: hypothetical protein H7067_16400 [Burkholderiales bacterium]|nr:hypothetical protein [Opitutaceae bacterium]